MNKYLLLFGFLLGLACLSHSVPVRIAHACYDCTWGIDYVVEDRIVFSNVQYQQMTDIVLHWPGTRRMQLRKTGTLEVLFDMSIYLNMENPITISLINYNDPSLNFFVNYDWAGAGPDFDQIAIKAVNLSPTSGAIDVLDKDGNVIISNLCFPARSEYVYLPYGQHSFSIRRVSDQKILYTTESKNIDNYQVNSLFFFGDCVEEDWNVHFITDEFHGYDLEIDGPNRPYTNPQITTSQICAPPTPA